MVQYRGLDKPKSQNYFMFWKSMFVALVIAFVGFMYVATDAIEYVWRWERVPQYFWLNEDVSALAEVEGEIASVVKSADSITVDIRDGAHEQRITLPLSASLLMYEGDYVYMGDTVATYKHNGPGILLDGIWVTLQVSMLAILLGIVIGVLTGLARISENPCLRWATVSYIELIRGSPLLVQIFLWYFVVGDLINALLAKLGFGVVPAFWFGVLSLAIFTGAYVAEIVRAGVQSVHKGQTEAARSLGLTRVQAMRKVVLPQAFRRILPPLAGQFISLIKDSSLLGVIAVRELTKTTREVISSSLMSYELWITCAILYLVLTFTLSLFVQYLERRAIR